MNHHLTAEQRQTLLDKLEAQRQDLRGEIHSEVLAADLHRAEDIADRVRDPGDEAVVDLLADLEYADIDRHVQILRTVESAIRAWHEGGYGLCVECGGEIPFDRLQANPAASRCLHCQAERERAGGRPPRL